MLDKIRKAQNSFREEYGIEPNSLFIGRDIQFIMTKDMAKLLNNKHIVPLRYLKFYGMRIIPVDADIYFAVGLTQNIMYDIVEV